MCGRFNQEQPSDKLLDKGLKFMLNHKHLFDSTVNNIAPGMDSIIVDSNFEYLFSEFGFRPVYDTSKLFINARAEGKGNETNETQYEIGIHEMSSFKKALLNNRCVIPVTGYIEGPEKEKLSNPFLIEYADKKTMYLAGIYNEYINKNNEKKLSFAIITTPANPICNRIGHHRSPLLLHEDYLEFWLSKDLTIDDIKAVLINIYSEPEMTATPLNPELVKSGKHHQAETMIPFGEVLVA